MRRPHVGHEARKRARRVSGLQLVIDHSWAARALDWLASGVPGELRRWFAGPVTVIRVDRGGHTIDGAIRRWRPVEFIVASDLILRRRTEVPSRRHREIGHLAELIVRSETPFSAGEVYGRLQTTAAAGAARPRHDLILVPRWPIDRALQDLRIAQRRVSGIFVEDGAERLRVGPKRGSIYQFSGNLSWAVPVLIAAIALGTFGASELAVRNKVLADLELDVASELAQLREIQSQRDVLDAAAARFDLARASLAEAAPAGWLLASLRSALPETAEVAQLELRGGVVRLQLRTPDALQAARTIGGALPGWSATIDGTIAVDARGGESATVSIEKAHQSP